MDRFELVTHLSQYLELKNKINNNLDEIQRLRSCMNKVTVTYKDAPGWDRKTSDQAVILTEIEKLSDHIKDDTAKLQGKYLRAEALIDKLDDRCEREVLQLIYVNGCSRKEIETKLGYSRVQIYRIQRKALKNLLKKIKLSTKDDTR